MHQSNNLKTCFPLCRLAFSIHAKLFPNLNLLDCWHNVVDGKFHRLTSWDNPEMLGAIKKLKKIIFRLCVYVTQVIKLGSHLWGISFVYSSILKYQEIPNILVQVFQLWDTLAEQDSVSEWSRAYSITWLWVDLSQSSKLVLHSLQN